MDSKNPAGEAGQNAGPSTPNEKGKAETPKTETKEETKQNTKGTIDDARISVV